MSAPFRISIPNLGGGHVDGIPAVDLADGQFAQLVNFYTYGPKIVRRRGVQEVLNLLYPEKVTSLFAFKTATGEWTLIAGTETGTAYMSGPPGSVLLNSIPNSLSLSTDSSPWHFRQYLDTLLAVRGGGSPLYRGNTTTLGTAGIPAPVIAASLSDGGPGSKVAGAYLLVYTFYDSSTDRESDPSPVSAPITLATSHSLDISNMEVSTTPGVDKKRLYLTEADQEGEYFRVAEIPNADTTLTGEDATIDDYGDAVEFTNGVPPSALIGLEVWNERVFVHDGTTVSYSNAGHGEAFAADSTIDVYPDDGHPIRAIHNWGDRLIIGKTRGIYFITGVTGNKFETHTLDDKIGCCAPLSMKSAEGNLFWFEGRDFYTSTGGPAVAMDSWKIRAILDSITPADLERVSAAVVPSLSWYIASIPIAESGNAVLVWNWKDKAWSVFMHGEAGVDEGQYFCTFLGDFFDAEGAQQVFALFDGQVGQIYRYNTGTRDLDFGRPYRSRFVTKAWTGSSLGNRITSRRLGLLCDDRTHRVGDVVAKLYLDGDTETAKKTRTLSLYDPSGGGRRWKYFNLSLLGKTGAMMQIGLEVTLIHGDDFQIEQMMLEGVGFDRMGRAR